MPATAIKSGWASGSLIFYESAVGRSVTGDVFTLGTSAVKIGNTSNDIDLQYYGTGSISLVLDCGAKTLTGTGIKPSFTQSAAGATGRVGYFAGSLAAPNLGDGYGAFEVDVTFSGTVAGTSAAFSSWVNLAAAAVPGGNMICAQNNGIYVPTGITASSAKMIMGMRMQYVADDGADPGSLFCFSTNIFSNALTAIFDVNAIADLGGSTGAQTGNDYKIPLFKDATAGVTWYVNVYHS